MPVDESAADDAGIYDVWERFTLEQVEAIHDGFARLALVLEAWRAGHPDVAVGGRGLALVLVALGFGHVAVVRHVLEEILDP